MKKSFEIVVRTLIEQEYSKSHLTPTEREGGPGVLLRGGEGRGEGGPGEEGGLQTGEEGENVVTGREAQVGMLDPVNSNTHQTSNPTRLLVNVLKVL